MGLRLGHAVCACNDQWSTQCYGLQITIRSRVWVGVSLRARVRVRVTVRAKVSVRVRLRVGVA